MNHRILPAIIVVCCLLAYSTENTVVQEVKTRDQILKDFSKTFPAEKQLLYEEVKVLIDSSLIPSPSYPGHQPFAALKALGPLAVPAIITQMDDRRPLPYRLYAYPVCSPDVFEAYAKYHMSVVVDALTNVLPWRGDNMHLDDPTERERVDAINRWRIFLHNNAEQYQAVRVEPGASGE